MSTRYTINEGERFGKLVVVSYTDRPNRKGEYKCICDCGNTTYARTSALKLGRHKSCGCIKKQLRPHMMLPNNLGAKKNIFHNYKKSALRRKYTFDLTLEQFIILIEGNCNYCNVPPYKAYTTTSRNRNQYLSNGIDRINNKEGYTVNNCVSCCEKCNMAKRLQTKEEFKNWIEKVYKNLFLEGSTTSRKTYNQVVGNGEHP